MPARQAMVGALIVTVLFETLYITLQGARGVPSHFNRATPWENVGATLMASGAYVLVGASAWVGAVAAWHWLHQSPAQREPMLLAIALGFILMFFLAGLTGAAMGQHRGPFVQPITGLGSPLPLTGWRTDIGDLRIAHFLGVHAMQAIPLLARAVTGRQRRPAHAMVVLSAAAWMALTVVSMQLALSNFGLL